jgi:hypothetical protein
MDVPGSNLLGAALSLITPQTVTFYRENGRTKNAAGQWLATYDAGVDFDEGSVQAVAKDQYLNRNLDWNKEYVSWFVPDLDAVNIARNMSGSVFEYNNRRYQMVGQTPWLSQDDWNEFMGVDIGPATGNLTNA